MRIFLDANVLFSAAVTPDGRSSALIELCGPAGHVLLASRHAISEARRNLERKRPDALDGFDRLVVPVVDEVPEPPAALVRRGAEAGLPDTDAPILAAAMACTADLLVTGDRRHFATLFGQHFHGVLVCSLADAIALLLA